MLGTVINKFHQDQFKVELSNFPEIDVDGPTRQVDLRLFSYFVKNIVIPDASIDTIQVDWMKGTRYQPISRANDNNPELTIEFSVDENMRNYHYCYTYIKQMRYGTENTIPDYRHTIKSIFIDTLNNEGKKLGRIEFTNCLLTSLGSLTLTVADSSELSFPASFKYEEFNIYLYDENGNLIKET
jgi:hypothetical protein